MKSLMVALIGLVSLAVAVPNAPAEVTSNTEVAPPFLNNDMFTYVCDTSKVNTINRIQKLDSKVVVMPVYVCPNSNCYLFDTGATCKESAIDPTIHIEDQKENKHYVCSNDGASVLICRYGFCSTHHYCNLKGPGAFCHTDCTCCKKGRQAERRIEGVQKRASLESSEPENLKMSAVTSEQTLTRAVIKMDMEPLQHCDTTGVRMCDDTFSAIFSCDNHNLWKLLMDCRPGRCVENLARGSAYCVENQETERLARTVEKKAEAAAAIMRVGSPSVKGIAQSSQPQQTCVKAGMFMCNIYGDGIFVCNSSLEWVLSADCRPGHCVNGPNYTAFCTQKVTGDVETRASAPPKQRCEKPGAYRCDATAQYIAVCSPEYLWELSASCAPGSCWNGLNDTAFCGSKRGPPATTEE